MFVSPRTRVHFWSTDETVVDIAERPGDSHSEDDRLVSRRPWPGRRLVAGVRCVLDGTYRVSGLSARQPNQYHRGVGRSHPGHVSQDVRGVKASRDCADCSQCRLGILSAPVQLLLASGVTEARNDATAAMLELRLLSQGGAHPRIPETEETIARLPMGTFGHRAVVWPLPA